jgi:uncharacterized Tic20 family protein
MINSQRQSDINRWGMILHLSLLLSFFITFAGVLLTLTIQQREVNLFRKDEARAIILLISTSFACSNVGGLLPIVLWQIKRRKFPAIDAHGKNICNWVMSTMFWTISAPVLTSYLVVFFGSVNPMLNILVMLLSAISILSILFPIIAAVKAKNGKPWRYPLSRFSF